MKTKLSNRALLKVIGTDAQNFLQNQLSNDIENIQENTIQLNSYCTHQGKIIALLRVFKIDGNFFLDFPKNLLEIVEKRLKMFVLMSKVEIVDVSNDFSYIGIIGEDKPQDALAVLSLKDDIYVAIYSNDNTLDNVSVASNEWNISLIEAKIPDITLATTGTFVPQMLNLDLDDINAVSFSKGCYPGQEVVARLHYLGKAKRRMFKFKTTQKDVKIGDFLFSRQSLSCKKTGAIVFSENIDDGSIGLACLEISQLRETICLNDANGVIMEIFE